MRKRHRKKGVFAIAFAVGLLVACFCPSQYIIAVLSIAIIVLGISYNRC